MILRFWVIVFSCEDLAVIVGSITKSIGMNQLRLLPLMLCDGIGVEYGAHYYGNGGAVSGTADLNASAVPEHSSVVAILTGLVGMVGVLKRRRS